MTTFVPNSFFTLSVTVQRRSATTSASGFAGGAYANLATTVPAGFVELSGDEAIRFQRLSNRYTGKFLFAPGQDVTTADRVVWGIRQFEVLSVIVRRYADGLESHREAIAAETTGGNG